MNKPSEQSIFWVDTSSEDQTRLGFDAINLKQSPIGDVIRGFLDLAPNEPLQKDAQLAMQANQIDQIILSGAQEGDLQNYLLYCLIAPIKDIAKLMTDYPAGKAKADLLIEHYYKNETGKKTLPVKYEGMTTLNMGQLELLVKGYQRTFGLLGGDFNNAFTQKDGFFNTDFPGCSLDGKITSDIVNHDFSNMTLDVRFGGDIDNCRFVNTQMSSRTKFYKKHESEGTYTLADKPTYMSNCTFINVDLSAVEPFSKEIGMGNVMRFVNLSSEQYKNDDLFNCVLRSCEDKKQLDHVKQDVKNVFGKKSVPRFIERKIQDQERAMGLVKPAKIKRSGPGLFSKGKSELTPYSVDELTTTIGKYTKRKRRNYSTKLTDALKQLQGKNNGKEITGTMIIAAVLDGFASVMHTPNKDSAITQLLIDLYDHNTSDFQSAFVDNDELLEKLRSKNLKGAPDLERIIKQSSQSASASKTSSSDTESGLSSSESMSPRSFVRGK